LLFDAIIESVEFHRKTHCLSESLKTDSFEQTMFWWHRHPVLHDFLAIDIWHHYQRTALYLRSIGLFWSWYQYLKPFLAWSWNTELCFGFSFVADDILCSGLGFAVTFVKLCLCTGCLLGNSKLLSTCLTVPVE
jgi:hypothetical protein